MDVATLGFQIFKVDAFTDKPFSGNPAGVCILSEKRSAEWMQAVAREMNLGATAFFLPKNDGYDLRWFTPIIELGLCGHGTLASAHILYEREHLKRDREARFYTKSGLLTAKDNGDLIELDFPSQPPQAAPAPDGLVEALDVKPRFVGKDELYHFVEVDSETIVRNLKPNFGLLGTVSITGVTVTAKASTLGFDFVSRFFAPKLGIDEDPATGSSHCLLGPFWSDRLHKTELVAYQASSRGGVIHIRVESDRVSLGGKAVTILQGELCC